MIIPYKVTFSAHVVPVARMFKILPKLLVLLRDAHATSKVKPVQGNVAATIARMKPSLNSLNQAVLKRADVTVGRVDVLKIQTRKIQTVCLAKMAKEKRSVHVLQKESDAPRSANAATAEIRSKQEEFALHWAQEENEEEKGYPTTRENVELNF